MLTLRGHRLDVSFQTIHIRVDHVLVDQRSTNIPPLFKKDESVSWMSWIDEFLFVARFKIHFTVVTLRIWESCSNDRVSPLYQLNDFSVSVRDFNQMDRSLTSFLNQYYFSSCGITFKIAFLWWSRFTWIAKFCSLRLRLLQ